MEDFMEEITLKDILKKMFFFNSFTNGYDKYAIAILDPNAISNYNVIFHGGCLVYNIVKSTLL